MLAAARISGGLGVQNRMLWKMSELVGRIGWIEYFVMILIDKVS